MTKEELEKMNAEDATQQEAPAEVVQLSEDRIRVIFDQPQRGITKGQAVVLYDGDLVIGGGTIV